MNLSSPFIQRPVMTSLVMLGILFFGILSYTWLPISDLPSIEFPTITVQGSNPGSNADLMAATVATTLEKQIMQIDGLRSVISQSQEGQTNIVVTFDLEKSIEAGSTDVSAAINRAAGNLPIEMPTPPTYQKFNPSASPVIYLSLSSDSLTQGDLYDYADTVVGQQISILPGASQVQIFGSERAIRIKVNPDTLRALGLGINEFTSAIQEANQNLPGGQVYNQYENYNLNPLGQLMTPASYEEIIVAYRNDAPVRVKDLAVPVDGAQNENFSIQYWTEELGEKPSVVVAVLKQSKANTVALCDDIHNLLPQMRAQLPGSIDFRVVYDRSTLIRASLLDVKITLVIAFILVVLVIFLFLGHMTSTIIPAISLPMSIIGTFMLMFLLGYSIDLLSLMALILIIGFLVDDAIVVLENIVRHMQMGKTPYQAAMDGSRQISTTVLSMTLSLASVFIPLVFMPGIIGRMFHEFGMVVVVAVLFSGLISLTLTPLLCSRLLKGGSHQTRLERMAARLIHFMLRIYEPMLRWTLHRRWIPMTLALAAIAISLYLFARLPQDFLPAGDTGAIEGILIAPESASPLAMQRYQTEVTNIIKKNSNIASVVSAANIPSLGPPNQAVIFANLKPFGERPPIDQVLLQLEEEIEKKIIGYRVFLKLYPEINLSVGTGQTRAPYAYAMSTIGDPAELYHLASEMVEKMQGIPELKNVSSDVENQAPMLNVEFLRDQASTYNLSTQEIENAFSHSYGGGRISTYSNQINTYDVYVELEDRFRKDPTSLERLYLAPFFTDESSQLVPLSSVVRVEETLGPITVNHVNQFVSATIFFDLAPHAALGTAVNKISKIADEVLPEAIMHNFQGEAEVFQGTMGSLVALMCVGIVVIYMLLGILYESFIHPITIISALPGALFGALVTLLIFQATLSIYAYVGIIVLIGIVMKNGIMLVEFANEQVEHGKNAFDAIIEASLIRFRPILMTTIAAGMGALPVALGLGASGSSMQPLGLVVVGGLIFSQFITYFFTPALYLTLEKIQEWMKRKKETPPPQEAS